MPKKCRVFLVDDEIDIVTSLKIGLEKNGIDVVAYSDPKEALAKYKAGDYDILILDIRMPRISGIQLLREIRKTDEKVKVLFLTAFEIQEKEWNIILPNTVVHGFINKPVSIENLIDAIATATEAP